MHRCRPLPCHPVVCAAVLLVIASSASTSARADVETLRFDVPSADLAIFGRFFAADFLGPSAGTILAARAELVYEVDETFDPEALLVTFQAPSDGVPAWRLSGPGLGWSGSGTFRATLATDELDGPIAFPEPLPDFSLFLIDIRTVDGRPLGGRFSASFFEVDVADGAGGIVPGDANADGRTDVSDAVTLLTLLFLGDPPPLPCRGDSHESPANRALLDGNGDGDVSLPDAVHVLSYLFRGGPSHVLGTGCLPIGGCPAICEAVGFEPISRGDADGGGEGETVSDAR